MIFLAVNTPTKTNGQGKGMAADLTNIENSAREIAKFANNNKIVVEKSTLPVRTAEKLKEILEESSNKISFQVLSNPEFLAEGTAIKYLFNSDRVLVGGDQTKEGKKAIDALVDIYKNWIPEKKILRLLKILRTRLDLNINVDLKLALANILIFQFFPCIQ